MFGGQLDKSQIELAKSGIDGLFQVIEDATGVVIAVEARPEGAALRVEGAFTAGSETDKVLAAEKPSALLCFERDPAACHRTLLRESAMPEWEAIDLAP